MNSKRFLYPLFLQLFLTGILLQSIGQSFKDIQSDNINDKAIQANVERANQLLDSYPDSSIYYGEIAYRMALKDELPELEFMSSRVIADAYFYQDSLLKAIEYYSISAETIRELEGESSENYAARISDIGFCFYTMEIFDLAVDYFNQSLALFSKTNNIAEISNQLNNLGSVYFAWGNYNMAIEYFSRTLAYDMERADSAALSTSYNNIGKVYETWAYYDLAIEHYLKSLDFLAPDDKARRAIRLSNIGTTYFKKDEIEKALDYLNESLLMDQELNNGFKMAVRYNEIASVLTVQGNYSKAIDYNLDALAIFQSLNKKESQAIVLKDLGNIYFETDNFPLAKDYFNRSISISQEIGSIANEMNAYKTLSQVYEKEGNYQDAMRFHQKFDALKDTIFNAQVHKQLANYRVRYETEKKERENQILKKDIIIKKRAQRTLIIVGSFMLMSTILLFLLLRLKSQTLKQDRKLHEQERKLSELELGKKDLEKQHLQDKVFAEKQLNRLQREKYEAELTLKNRELVSSTLQLVNKNEVLSEIKDKIKYHKATIPQNALNDLMHLVNHNTDFDQNWKKFRIEFEKINPGFFDRIQRTYPDLSEQFVRLSSFLRIDLTTKEIAQLMNVSVAAVNKNRQRLRKKLNLEAEADLSTYMKSL